MFTASSSTHSLLLASPVKDSYCSPSYSFGAHHSPWAELRAQKRFCSHVDLAPSIPCPNPCHTATWPFSPSLQCIKLPYLGASALAVSALFIEILWLFSSKSPPTGVLI